MYLQCYMACRGRQRTYTLLVKSRAWSSRCCGLASFQCPVFQVGALIRPVLPVCAFLPSGWTDLSRKVNQSSFTVYCSTFLTTDYFLGRNFFHENLRQESRIRAFLTYPFYFLVPRLCELQRSTRSTRLRGLEFGNISHRLFPCTLRLQLMGFYLVYLSFRCLYLSSSLLLFCCFRDIFLSFLTQSHQNN